MNRRLTAEAKVLSFLGRQRQKLGPALVGRMVYANEPLC